MHSADRPYRHVVTASALAAAALLAGVPPAAAKDGAVTPVTRHIESVEVAPALEHRLLIVHPVLGRAPAVKRDETVALGGVASPDLLAFGLTERDGRQRAEALSFGKGATVLVAGDVLRTETADFAVTKDTVVAGATPLRVPLLRISREVEADPKAAEPTMLGPVLPSALRFQLLSDAGGQALREAADRWAADVQLTTPRRSPAELSSAESIAKRAAGYRKAFATLPKPGADREIVGCAILLDGAVASVETFGSGELFAAAWPRLLDAAATEAAVEEARANLLAADLADPADPDRFLTDLKKRLLDVFGARATVTDVKEEGRLHTLAIERAAANALVLADDRVVHFVLVTDPAHRADPPPGEGIDPRAAARKARPTEEERRLIERREGAPLPPAPAEPPPAPAPR